MSAERCGLEEREDADAVADHVHVLVQERHEPAERDHDRRDHDRRAPAREEPSLAAARRRAVGLAEERPVLGADVGQRVHGRVEAEHVPLELLAQRPQLLAVEEEVEKRRQERGGRHEDELQRASEQREVDVRPRDRVVEVGPLDEVVHASREVDGGARQDDADEDHDREGCELRAPAGGGAPAASGHAEGDHRADEERDRACRSRTTSPGRRTRRSRRRRAPRNRRRRSPRRGSRSRAAGRRRCTGARARAGRPRRASGHRPRSGGARAARGRAPRRSRR